MAIPGGGSRAGSRPASERIGLRSSRVGEPARRPCRGIALGPGPRNPGSSGKRFRPQGEVRTRTPGGHLPEPRSEGRLAPAVVRRNGEDPRPSARPVSPNRGSTLLGSEDPPTRTGQKWGLRAAGPAPRSKPTTPPHTHTPDGAGYGRWRITVSGASRGGAAPPARSVRRARSPRPGGGPAPGDPAHDPAVPGGQPRAKAGSRPGPRFEASARAPDPSAMSAGNSRRASAPAMRLPAVSTPFRRRANARDRAARFPVGRRPWRRAPHRRIAPDAPLHRPRGNGDSGRVIRRGRSPRGSPPGSPAAPRAG